MTRNNESFLLLCGRTLTMDWVAPYRNDVPEVDNPIELPVTGLLPPSLRGWYFRNGPGKFRVGKEKVAHPFDGDGAVCRIQFDGPKSATLLIQYVKTDEFIAESATSRQMSRGSFGTNIQGGQMANVLDVLPKNAANISVMWLGGRLFALFEGGQPYELNPHTLHTLCCSSMGGLLKMGAPFSVNGAISGLAERALSSIRSLRQREPRNVSLSGDAFASHYRRDAERQLVVGMSYQVDASVGHIGGLHTDMRFYEFDDRGTTILPVAVKNVRLPGYAFVHDFAITRDYIVVMLNPLTLDFGKYILGKLSPIHCLKYNAMKRMQIYIIPRQIETGNSTAHIAEALFGWPCQKEHAGSEIANGGVRVFSLRPHFVQHIANAWTEGSPDGTKLHIQYVGYPEMPDFMSWSGPGNLYEHIDPDSQPASRLMHAVLSILPVIGPVPQSDTSYRNTSMGDLGPMTEYLHSSDPANVMGTLNAGQKVDTSKQSQQSIRLQEKLPPSVKLPNSGVTRIVSSRVMEFPQINPLFCGKESRYVFGASSLHQFKNRPQQAIGAYDCLTGQCKIWTRGWRYYVGEPEMIPSLPQHRRGHVPLELDGWILSICYDADRDISEVIILDAADITQGPIATATLPFVIPHGLHGAFVPQQTISNSS